MLDILVVCEGQTEREFCREVVAPYLAPNDIALAGTLVGKPQRKRGGVRPWPIYRAELLRLAKERADRHVALLVDYYAMPDSWPGREDSRSKPASQRGTYVEHQLEVALQRELPGRFHPCVQLHEFESLLFVDADITALSIAVAGRVVNHQYIARQMNEIRVECNGSVEEINDSPEKSPSKRLLKLMPGYDKVAWGVTAAADISIPVLTAGCPWLNRWLNRVGGLVKG